MADLGQNDMAPVSPTSRVRFSPTRGMAEDARANSSVVFELRLQRHEIGIGLELGIVLCHRQQPAERAGQLVLRVLKRFHLVGISKIGSLELDLRRLGARFDHRGKYVFLLRSIALHGRHEIGNEIGTALILILHVRPACLGRFLKRRSLCMLEQPPAASFMTVPQLFML